MVKKKVFSLVDNGSKIVSPENILDIHDEFSISLNPTEQYYNDPDRFVLWSAYVYKYLKDRIKYSRLWLYPELSGKGRLHMHGYIEIDDKAKFYLFDVPYLVQLGNTEIDTICVTTCNHEPDQEDCSVKRWLLYVKKQQSMMHPLTETNVLYSDGYMSIG